VPGDNLRVNAPRTMTAIGIIGYSSAVMSS
jgi:hypothetical protein